ncbi:MAG TPA: hypothetical protein PLS63_06470 [Microthrixaceae bacterium]|nr:hypothetical protein [Microthrixaceae bacterium]
MTRMHRTRRAQGGSALIMVLALLVVGVTITLASLAFASTSLRTGSVYQRRDAKIASERDALGYLVAVIRPDLTKGVQGNTQSATVAGVTATCVGQTGSGQVSGIGRTDRVIACNTPSIAATYRIFDRSGDKPGIIVETLSATTR